MKLDKNYDYPWNYNDYPWIILIISRSSRGKVYVEYKAGKNASYS